jgi:hypothetical protein
MRSLRTTLLVLLGMFFLAGPALAQSQGITTDSIESNWGKLTEEQKASLAASIAQQAGKNDVTFNGTPIPKNVSAEDVAPWLSLIDKVGEGLVRLAKELGVTANELLRTPVGVITVGLVAYHVMGNEIMGILVGLLFFAIAMPVWLLCFYKLVIPVVKYETVKQSHWYRSNPIEVQVPVRRRCTFDDDSGPEWVSTISLVLIFFVTIIFIA